MSVDTDADGPGPRESHYDRWLKARLAEDPEFKAEYESQLRQIKTIDAIINTLEGLREEQCRTKAELARTIGKNPAAIRRLLTASGNPELRTVIALADALGADVRIVPRRKARTRHGASRDNLSSARSLT